MAERKPGPVKPPIIDAKPRAAEEKPRAAAGQPAAAGQTPRIERQAETRQPETEAPATETAPESPSAPETPAREAETAAATRPAPGLPLLPLAATGLGGAALALALAYGLAAAGYWPQPASDAPAALSALEARAGELQTALARVETEAGSATTRLDALESGLDARLGEIAGAVPALPGDLASQSDLDTLSGRLDDLAARIDALAAGASGAEASGISTRLSTLADEVAALSSRLDAAEPQIAAATQALDDATTRLDDLDTRIADQSAFETLSAERDRLAQLPVALEALEAGLASGAPFAARLAALEPLLPGLSVPPEARAAAASGVASAPQLLTDFRAAIPAILAARPIDPEADWTQTLFDQAAAALALRPTDGDSPDALVGRTETALEAGDLEAARAAFAALPDPMRAAAPGFAQALDHRLAAEALLASVRAAAGTETAR